MIALMVAEGENWQDVMIPSAGAESAPVSAQPDTSAAESVPASKSQKSQYVMIRCSIVFQHQLLQKLRFILSRNYGPAVRSLLELYQLDSSQIPTSGRNNKLLKTDVLNYISERKLSPKPPAPGENVVPNSRETLSSGRILTTIIYTRSPTTWTESGRRVCLKCANNAAHQRQIR